MIQEYSSSAQIDAPPDAVWRVLTNAAGYRDWNEEIVAVNGTFAAGARITAHVKLGNGAVRRVAQRVVVFDAPRTMEWIGGLPFGLFVGRRTFTVSPRANGTEFRMHIQMSGPLASLILKSVGDRQQEIDRFSRSLKARIEAEGDRRMP
jgi:carbon monoxide dehydrogenase subunit G